MTFCQTVTILFAAADTPETRGVRSALERAGYQLLGARGSEEVQHIAALDLPDLILLDTDCGGQNGLAICRQLKAHALTRDIPVMLLAAPHAQNVQTLGFELGAVDVLTRPLDKNELLARVRLRLHTQRKGQDALAQQGARLEQVRRAQLDLMPRPEEQPQARFGIAFVPVLEAGGDYYDVFAVDDEVTAYCVADVSGHDLGASFASPVIKAALRTSTQPGDPPWATLQAVNRALRTVLRDGQHVTACLAFVNRRRRRIQVANAAHPAPFRLTADGRANPVDGGGDVLGVFPRPEFDRVELDFAPGERLFLYTDGVVEPLGGATRDRATGLARLVQVCRQVAALPVQVAVPEVLVQAFAGEIDLEDDFVLLGVEL